MGGLGFYPHRIIDEYSPLFVSMPRDLIGFDERVTKGDFLQLRSHLSMKRVTAVFLLNGRSQLGRPPQRLSNEKTVLSGYWRTFGAQVCRLNRADALLRQQKRRQAVKTADFIGHKKSGPAPLAMR